MSPVIRIPEELFGRLQRHATAFVDTPATVIERVLDEWEQLRRRPEEKPMRTSEAETITEVGKGPTPLASPHQAHPGYARAHPGSKRIHDAIVDRVFTDVGGTAEAELHTLVFKAPKNFAAVQSVLVRSPAIDVSIFGRVEEFVDPLRLLQKGRFDHWSAFRIDDVTDLDYAMSLIKRAHQLRGDRR
jgi:hypothetical protein